MVTFPDKIGLQNRLSPMLIALKRPTSWLLLGLGFSASLPFLLVGATLSSWLRKDHMPLTLIGFMSWVSMLYGLKILWAPWMDKVRLPFLFKWLGQRRSYMLLAQTGVAVGLIAMALIGPDHITAFITAAVFVTFAAASQEIAVDAWRVEMTNSQADQAINPSFYAFGYKIGIWLTGSLVLIFGNHLGWPTTYKLLAGLMVIGLITTLLAHPTEVETAGIPKAQSLKALIIDPFTSFYQEHKGTAGLILLTLVFYRLPDYLIGPVAQPMYQDTGLNLDMIGVMRGSLGLVASFGGVAIGGSCLLFFGLKRAFFLGALAGPLSNLAFSWLSLAQGDLRVFGFALVVDDIGDGIAETALVAFMTRMTGRDHTLTHYALMYSFVAFTGKLLKGFSGQMVDMLTPYLGLFPAYSAFFTATAVMSLPTAILYWNLQRKGVFSPR